LICQGLFIQQTLFKRKSIIQLALPFTLQSRPFPIDFVNFIVLAWDMPILQQSLILTIVIVPCANRTVIGNFPTPAYQRLTYLKSPLLEFANKGDFAEKSIQ
jgi:hypothetical protein